MKQVQIKKSSKGTKKVQYDLDLRTPSGKPMKY